MIKEINVRLDGYSILHVTGQVLVNWGYELVEDDWLYIYFFFFFLLK